MVVVSDQGAVGHDQTTEKHLEIKSSVLSRGRAAAKKPKDGSKLLTSGLLTSSAVGSLATASSNLRSTTLSSGTTSSNLLGANDTKTSLTASKSLHTSSQNNSSLASGNLKTAKSSLLSNSAVLSSKGKDTLITSQSQNLNTTAKQTSLMLGASDRQRNQLRSGLSVQPRVSVLKTSHKVGMQGSNLLASHAATTSSSLPQPRRKDAPTSKLGLQDISKDRSEQSGPYVPPPTYNIDDTSEDATSSGFVVLESTTALHVPEGEVSVDMIKQTFLNAVSSSLIGGPDYYKRDDPTRQILIALAEQVIAFDGEFILKVALYTRQELNIRSTANFLLALAAKHEESKIHLRKYFTSCIRLPSDWIEVAQMYQTFYDGTLNYGSLPAALRKAMSKKFPDFDEYQLGKYNKQTKKPKGDKKSNQKKSSEMEKALARTPSADPTDHDPILLEKMSFTLKQLIRKLHIREPVYHVMALIGKKYPVDRQKFSESRLPGVFDPEKAGARMKLKVPETWETQVSLKGNVAETWETLIDHRKLPFMAMLRNLRNIIYADVKSKYHDIICRKLRNEQTVMSSRQFPFRFFSAYEVLSKILNDRGRPRKGHDHFKTSGKDIPVHVIRKFQEALDEAVVIAARYNVKPIRGTTMILCDVSSYMKIPCTSARGLGKPRMVLEVGLLLGLMCYQSCEDSQLIIFGENVIPQAVTIQPGDILKQLEKLLEKVNAAAGNVCAVCSCPLTDAWESSCNCASCFAGCQKGESTQGGSLPIDYLLDAVKQGAEIDSVLYLSNQTTQHPEMARALDKYRRVVNPNLLFVNVDLSGEKSTVELSNTAAHENDVSIAGYSDQILRFIAERGERASQLTYVDNIDLKYNLVDEVVQRREAKLAAEQQRLKSLGFKRRGASGGKPSTKEVTENDVSESFPALSTSPLGLSTKSTQLKVARVFISSTFRDMHGERDILTRYVFPQLRQRASKYGINVYEVDLRWGVTEEDTRHSGNIALCLREVSQSAFFVGMLGERYGWVPNEYEVPDTPEFDWVHQYPKNRSITELEMENVLHDPTKVKDRAFFAIRDESFLQKVPSDHQQDFATSSDDHKAKLSELKKKVRSSGLEVMDGYECNWGGVLDNKPMAVDLEKFGAFFLEKIWNGIKSQMIDTAPQVPQEPHQQFIDSQSPGFVGRKKLLKAIQTFVNGDTDYRNKRFLTLSGGPGIGKSALMVSSLVNICEQRSSRAVVGYFVGSTPKSTELRHLLTTMITTLVRRFSLDIDLSTSIEGLKEQFVLVLELGAQRLGSWKDEKAKLVVYIDALDQLENTKMAGIDWLPEKVPKDVVLVVSTKSNTDVHKMLRTRDRVMEEIVVKPLVVGERRQLVQSILSRYRKSLSDGAFGNQMPMLTSKREAGSPLFLSVACEELRVRAQYDTLDETLKSMSSSLEGLFLQSLERLEIEHGALIMKIIFRLFLCAKNGLRENDMLHLISMSWKKEEGISNTSTLIPTAALARIMVSLKPFLSTFDRNGSLVLFHKELVSVAWQRYFASGRKDITDTHNTLALYYRSLIDPKNDLSFTGTDPIGFVALPYHLATTSQWKLYKVVLCNISFIQGKCTAGLGIDLLDDFNNTVGDSSFRRDLMRLRNTPLFQDYRSFVERNLHIIATRPSLTLQQALNEPDGSSVAKEAITLLSARRELYSMAPRSSDLVLQWQNKPQAIGNAKQVANGFNGIVNCLALSPDKSRLACGMSTGTIRILDSSSFRELATMSKHSNAISSLCFNGEKQLCSAAWDMKAIVWDAETYQPLVELVGHNRRVNAIAASPDTRTVVTASWDCTMKVWDARTGKVQGTLKSQSNPKPINTISFHPEGQFVVTGDWAGKIAVWDTINFKLVAEMSAPSSIRSVCFAPSGRHIVCSTKDGLVTLWSAATYVQVGTFCGHLKPINQCVYSETGQELVTVSNDRCAKQWQGLVGKLMQDVGDGTLGRCLDVKVTPDGATIGVAYNNCAVGLYRKDGSLIVIAKDHTSAVTKLAWCKNSEFLASASKDIVVYSKKRNFVNPLVLKGHVDTVTALSFSNQRSKLILASGSRDQSVRIWSLGEDSFELMSTLYGHENTVTACAFTSSGHHLLTAGRDMRIVLWKVRSDVPVKTFRDCHTDWINDLAITRDETKIVTCSNDFQVKIWSVEGTNWGPSTELAELQSLIGHTGAVTSVALSRTHIASSSYDRCTKLWSFDGTEVTSIGSPDGNCVHACDFSRQELLATACDDGHVRIYQPFEGLELNSMLGHSDRVVAAALGSDHSLFTSSLDGSLRSWDTAVKASTATHQAPVVGVVFPSSRDASFLASIDSAGFAALWAIAEKSVDFVSLQRLPVQSSFTCKVTACCAGPSDDEICAVVGDDAGGVRLVCSDGTSAFQLQSKVDVPVPVTAVAASNSFVAVGGWQGYVELFDSDLDRISVLKTKGNKGDAWVSSLQITEERLVATFQDGNIVTWDCHRETVVESISLAGHGCVWNKPWLTTTNSMINGELVSCNSNGSIVDSSGKEYVQGAHCAAISFSSAIEASNNSLVKAADILTGGKDGALKFWKFTSGHNLEQTGEFNTRTSITALDVAADTIAIGDELGFVYFLRPT